MSKNKNKWNKMLIIKLKIEKNLKIYKKIKKIKNKMEKNGIKSTKNAKIESYIFQYIQSINKKSVEKRSSKMSERVELK